MNSGPVHESHDPNFQISSTNPVNMALQTMLIAFLLSSISITLLILHLDFLTYNACQAEVGILDGSCPDTQLVWRRSQSFQVFQAATWRWRS